MSGRSSPRDGRRHLPERWIAFNVEQFLHAYAAEGANAPKIIPNEIDDHHVLGAILGVAGKPVSDLAIFASGSTAGRRSLHGLCRDASLATFLLHAEEELRRKRQDVPAFLAVQERAVVDRLRCSKAAEKRRRPLLDFQVNRKCEIKLIHIPGADPLVNLLDACRELLFVETERHQRLRYRRKLKLAAKIRRPAIDKLARCVIEAVAALVDAEPCEQFLVATPPESSAWLEECSALVSEKARGEVSPAHRLFNLREQTCNIGQRPHFQNAHRIREDATQTG